VGEPAFQRRNRPLIVPELPEVEILVRHLGPLLQNKTIRGVQVRRAKVLRPTSSRQLSRTLTGGTFVGVRRRGKYLLFELQRAGRTEPITLVGHLGMTGRIYLAPSQRSLPKHAAVILDLGVHKFIFEDTRYFGRLTLDPTALGGLGPEPLGGEFTVQGFASALKRSAQPIKVKLLDQSLVAGIGNIYASEALFQARLSPLMAARSLKPAQVTRLWQAIRLVLSRAIAAGSTVPLNFAGGGGSDGLFYFGRAEGTGASYVERLEVYDREGLPCVVCGAVIKRRVQAARSTFFCPRCQRR
jgi:formamidopyrimidine-DNA glycosylase